MYTLDRWLDGKYASVQSRSRKRAASCSVAGMSKSLGPQLPPQCKGIQHKQPRSALPTPPPSSELYSQGDDLLSELSDIEITSSPPRAQYGRQVDEPLRKRKHWQIDEDAIIVKLVLLRKLFPHRKDINWCTICTDLSSATANANAYQPGRVRSRFFSTMHSLANAHGISNRDLCRQLAMPFESNISTTPEQTPFHIMSDPIPVSHGKCAAIRKLDDLAFNAKLKEARQASCAHRPDLLAQRRASEGLRSQLSSQIPSSPPVRTTPTTTLTLGLNEKMAAIPILSDSFPIPSPRTPHLSTPRPPPSRQQPRLERSQLTTQMSSAQNSTQRSDAAAQLHSDLSTYAQSVHKQQWEWSDETRGYVAKVGPALDQNAWRNSTEIYKSAIAYNVKVRKGKNREKLFVYENPLMSEQVKKKRLLDLAQAQKRARRRERREVGRSSKIEKKARVGKKTKKDPSLRNKRRASGVNQASQETSKRFKELQARLAAKALGQK